MAKETGQEREEQKALSKDGKCVLCEAKYYPPTLKSRVINCRRNGRHYYICEFHYGMLTTFDDRRDEMHDIIDAHLSASKEAVKTKNEWDEMRKLFAPKKRMIKTSWLWRTKA